MGTALTDTGSKSHSGLALLSKRKARQSALYHVLLILAVIGAAFPVYWILLVSLKTPKGIYREPSFLIQFQTLDNFTTLLYDKGFLINLKNSLVVAGSTTIISVIIASVAAYALVRLRFPLRDWAGRSILMTYLLPGSLLFIPLYVVLSQLGLGDSHPGLVLAYLTHGVPFCTWLMMGYFKGIPVDLEEAAMIDGASRLGALFRILLPIAAPGMITASIFTFTLAWDDVLYALSFITTQELQTAPVAISGLMIGDVYMWGEIMAGALVSSAPVIILYFLAQRFVVEGLSAGAVKG